jgi:hypothetical protein
LPADAFAQAGVDGRAAMGERETNLWGARMTRTSAVIIAAVGMLGSAATIPAAAQTAPRGDRPVVTEFSAQSRPARPRTRVRVTPAYPYRTFSTDYPVPYKYEYPGPGAVRQCASWLRSEYRLSGTVIVPKMQCWWEPG